jgi:hypothetical protein
VPIVPRQVAPGEKNRRDFIDFLSIHALGPLPLNLSADEVDKPEFENRVFNWQQLR